MLQVRTGEQNIGPMRGNPGPDRPLLQESAVRRQSGRP